MSLIFITSLIVRLGIRIHLSLSVTSEHQQVVASPVPTYYGPQFGMKMSFSKRGAGKKQNDGLDVDHQTTIITKKFFLKGPLFASFFSFSSFHCRRLDLNSGCQVQGEKLLPKAPQRYLLKALANITKYSSYFVRQSISYDNE